MPNLFRSTLVVLLASALTGGPGTAQVIPGGSARDYDERHSRRELEYRSSVLGETSKLMEEWTEAWSSDRTDRINLLYTEDAVLVPADGTPMARGRSEIVKYFERTLASAGEITTSFQDFDVAGSLAFAMGTFSYTAPTLGTGSRTLKGRFVAIFRLEGGRWKIRSHIFDEQM